MKLSDSIGKNTVRMPVIFVGHGSPMFTLGENEFVQGWKGLTEKIPVPEAILCISAHWQTNGTYVTAMHKPRTIHDFGGFPEELYTLEYPAPGDPRLAEHIRSNFRPYSIGSDYHWGIDHGAWCVLRHIYPKADIPVIELSLDYNMNPGDHYSLAAGLGYLRDRGILIIGSGNMVHNLAMIAMDRSGNEEYGFEWAVKASNTIKYLISSGDHRALTEYHKLGKEVRLSVPTPEHFLPLLYILALKKNDEPLEFFNEKAVMGSLSMTSLKIG